MKLTKIIVIRAQINCLTGLHIGGGDTEIHIGGIDNQVIKNPITRRPYIPGSSIKGKMRSMLEWCSGSVGQNPVKIEQSDNPEVFRILQLFGMGPVNKKFEERAKEIGASRLSFWDCNLNEEWRLSVEAGDNLLTEAKMENQIDRIAGVAKSPRQTERVPSGALFDFKLTLKIYDTDDEKALVETTLRGMKLLEMDSLGGSGSRGYGKVRFENVEIDPAQEGIDYSQIKPFG